MSKLNYAQIEQAIADKREFVGNSCQGYYENGEYVVVSYNTTIAKATRSVVAGAERGTELWVNPRKYSNTTSRLQNIIKRVWGV